MHGIVNKGIAAASAQLYFFDASRFFNRTEIRPGPDFIAERKHNQAIVRTKLAQECIACTSQLTKVRIHSTANVHEKKNREWFVDWIEKRVVLLEAVLVVLKIIIFEICFEHPFSIHDLR